jgi:thiol-disulfide isomerase/thioredoxin
MTQATYGALAPELETSQWLNTLEPLRLSGLKGKVIVIHVFQLLCPGCVSHGIPQASAIHELYADEEVQVIGLYTVFEHHDVMTVEAAHEYRIRFPIAVDRPSTSGTTPVTMERYRMQGTPTLIVIDKKGRVRLNHFGRLSDMQVGNFIGGLLTEDQSARMSSEATDGPEPLDGMNCDEDGCLL